MLIYTYIVGTGCHMVRSQMKHGSLTSDERNACSKAMNTCKCEALL